jgi:predicted membrane channel-forming protein YqfA (hemolysin III family)
LIASLGIVTSIFGIFLVFIPPAQFKNESVIAYVSFLVIGLVSMVALPLIIHAFKKPSWNPAKAALKEEEH